MSYSTAVDSTIYSSVMSTDYATNNTTECTANVYSIDATNEPAKCTAHTATD